MIDNVMGCHTDVIPQIIGIMDLIYLRIRSRSLCSNRQIFDLRARHGVWSLVFIALTKPVGTAYLSHLGPGSSRWGMHE